MDEIVELPPTPPASPAVESNRSSGEISYQDPLPPPPHPILQELFQEMLHFPINVPSPTTSSDDFVSEFVPPSQPNCWLDLRARAAPLMQLLIYTLALLAILFGALAIIIYSHKHQTNHHCGIKLTVAQDGKSQYQTIFEAVQASPSYSSSRVCVVIGKGEYYENIDIPEENTNLVFIGDGVEDTVIVSDRSPVIANRSIATLWVRGKHFVAQDLTVKNTALEGLALKIYADQSVFFNCKFEGATTTVHIKDYKQFFSNCTFYGRNNLIVADSSYTFFQECEFNVVKLYPEEKLVFIDQPHNFPLFKRTKLTFYLCGFNTIGRAIKGPASTFIGGALDHDYAGFAVIKSFLDERIAGYLLDGSSVTSASVAIYGNTGPGSAMKVIPPYIQKLVDLSTASASEYSLRTLLHGESWIPEDVAYELDFT